ncbi:MAG TPA: DUF4131 domain-containing protein, partial [Nitrospiria bacterium]
MKKPLIFAAVCYLGGLVLGEALNYFPLTLASLGLACVGAVIVRYRGRRASAAVMLTAFGLALFGMLRMQHVHRDGGTEDLLRFAKRDTVRLTGTVDGPVRRGPGGAVVMVSVHTVTTGGADHPVRGRLRMTARDFDPPLSYG